MAVGSWGHLSTIKISVENLEGSSRKFNHNHLFGEVVLEKDTISDEIIITTVTSFIWDM